MDFTANSVDWNAVALVIIATAILSWVYFRTNWPKKRRQSIVLLGSAMVVLALYSGIFCAACEVKPYLTCDSNSMCGPISCSDTIPIYSGSSSTTRPVMYYPNGCSAANLACDQVSTCANYLKCKGKYDSKVAACAAEPSGGSGSGTSTRTQTEYAEDKAAAKAGHDAFISSQRSVCSANNNGLLFDPNSYYCDGFPNYASYKSPKQANGNTFPEYSTDIGCCIGKLITKTGAAANSSFASGSDNNLTQLNSTTIDLTQRHVTSTDGKSQVCISRDYLCTDAAISGSPLVSSISCSDTATTYCPNGCDFNTANCVTTGTTGTQSFDIGSITIFLLLIGAIVIVVIIAVRKRWR